MDEAIFIEYYDYLERMRPQEQSKDEKIRNYFEKVHNKAVFDCFN